MAFANRYIFLIAVLLLVASCDRPDCINKNPIIEEYSPWTNEYKAELAKQINHIGQENLNYWFDAYLTENGKEYIQINIQNDSLCAIGIIEVNDWSKIKGLRRTKGGYNGAGLIGLKMNIQKTEDSYKFVFKDIDHISD